MPRLSSWNTAAVILSNTQTLNTSTITSTYSIPLSGLSPGTTYTYRLNPFDTGGNIYASPASYAFTTPPQTGITNVAFQPIPGALTGTEQMNWTTNVPSTSQISYGPSRRLKAEPAGYDYDYPTHMMTIGNLNYSTQYSGHCHVRR